MYCNVLVTRPFDQSFTYKAKAKQIVKVGSVVSVSFGRKKDQIGIICSISNKQKEKGLYKIKEIDHVFDKIILNKKIIEFLEWIAEYTLAPKGLVLKLFLINYKIINHEVKNYKSLLFKSKSIILNSEQKKAYETIYKSFNNKKNVIVLEGVTGSGKTEVYFKLVEKILKKNKQVLILLPEISLTPQFELRFKERFGFAPDIWHSKISESKKKDIWHRCFSGEPIIVIGARSSLFLPFSKLGLVVVDEEHDLSFKQEDNIRYQARDLAIVKSKIENFPIVLSSATPSLETENNIRKNKFLHTFLSNQFSGISLPTIELIDLKKEKLEKNKWISNKILSQIQDCVHGNRQALLFLNRRGYSPLSLCSDCGYRYKCDYCSSWLVNHRNKNRLLCHHCGRIYPLNSICPSCKKKDRIKLIGPGVERLAEELKQIFPKFNVGIMSSDTANTPNKVKDIIENFSSQKIDVLVATQIMAKGYHFPNLSFVGIIDADSGLMGGDVRAVEKTYNLLQQVGGRAGRSKELGKVFIQTYFPEQPIMQSIKNRDRKKFIEESLFERRQFDAPPFSFMTAIIISGSSKSKTEKYSNDLVKNINLDSKTHVLGPVEAPIFLLRGKYRFRILLKSQSRLELNRLTRQMIKKCPVPANLRLVIDVDPYTFL